LENLTNLRLIGAESLASFQDFLFHHQQQVIQKNPIRMSFDDKRYRSHCESRNGVIVVFLGPCKMPESLFDENTTHRTYLARRIDHAQLIRTQIFIVDDFGIEVETVSTFHDGYVKTVKRKEVEFMAGGNLCWCCCTA
jgi:hypothetical protein